MSRSYTALLYFTFTNSEAPHFATSTILLLLHGHKKYYYRTFSVGSLWTLKRDHTAANFLHLIRNPRLPAKMSKKYITDVHSAVRKQDKSP
jgi:hypothetical protein